MITRVEIKRSGDDWVCLVKTARDPNQKRVYRAKGKTKAEVEQAMVALVQEAEKDKSV